MGDGLAYQHGKIAGKCLADTKSLDPEGQSQRMVLYINPKDRWGYSPYEMAPKLAPCCRHAPEFLERGNRCGGLLCSCGINEP